MLQANVVGKKKKHTFYVNFFFENRAVYEIHKAIKLQAWTGPEGSRRLRLQDFKTIGT
jgi:hypothetical protein